MNNQLNNNRLTIILIGSMALVSLILLFTVIALRRNQDTTQNLKKAKQKTTQQIPSITPTPTDNLPTDLPKPTFTGAVLEDLPEDEVEQIEQMRQLRNAVPIETESFRIDFDWNSFKYIVGLKEPRDKAKKDFEQWLEQNYPKIPKKEFLFKNI